MAIDEWEDARGSERALRGPPPGGGGGGAGGRPELGTQGSVPHPDARVRRRILEEALGDAAALEEAAAAADVAAAQVCRSPQGVARVATARVGA